MDHQGHSHPHKHDHDHAADAEGIINAIRGTGGKGARVTLYGLLLNVALTGVKAAAGWFLNSAVMLADAGHSLSDLMGDIVTLIFYTISRRPASAKYPYGFGKFESLGTSTVAVFLLLGAYAIGTHSYDLLQESGLFSYIPILSPFFPQSENKHNASVDESIVDPNAAWVAVLSIVAKEFMYRLTAKVARAENSPVLMANALHHRSDMYSSFVSIVAILGTWLIPSLPLDPLGGLLVTFLILHQALELLSGSLNELTDASPPDSTLSSLSSLISAELSSSPLLASSDSKIEQPFPPRDLRALRRGAHTFVDVTVDVEGSTSAMDLARLEDALRRRVQGGMPDVKELRVKFVPLTFGERDKHGKAL